MRFFQSVSRILNIRAIIGLIFMGALAACASLDVTVDYRPPSQAPIASTATVKKPFDQAWDGFIRKISQSFFVVNNLSKESRLINISVGQSRAGEFIDCGSADYTVNSKPWRFNPAKDATFNDSGFRSETILNHRVRGAGGRMNIFVAPDGPDTTIFEVNTSYTIEMRQTGRDVVRNLLGQVVSQRDFQEENASFQFTTKQPDQQPLGPATITCQATGVWEQLVLDLAR